MRYNDVRINGTTCWNCFTFDSWIHAISEIKTKCPDKFHRDLVCRSTLSQQLRVVHSSGLWWDLLPLLACARKKFHLRWSRYKYDLASCAPGHWGQWTNDRCFTPSDPANFWMLNPCSLNWNAPCMLQHEAYFIAISSWQMWWSDRGLRLWVVLLESVFYNYIIL